MANKLNFTLRSYRRARHCNAKYIGAYVNANIARNNEQENKIRGALCGKVRLLITKEKDSGARFAGESGEEKNLPSSHGFEPRYTSRLLWG